MATDQYPVEQDRGRLQAALRQRCRSEGNRAIDRGQVERVVNSAVHQHELAFVTEIVDRLRPGVHASLQALVESEGAPAGVKADPGPLGLDTLMSEIATHHCAGAGAAERPVRPHLRPAGRGVAVESGPDVSLGRGRL